MSGDDVSVRLFVAVWPDADTIERLRRVVGAEHVDDHLRLVRPENWHVTLRFLGDADPSTVADRLSHASLPTTTVRLGPRTVRLGRRQIVVPAAGVEPLAEVVRRATAGIGVAERHTFFGHVTLARTKPEFGDAMIGLQVDGEFVARSVALVASELRPTGPVYTTVATFATNDEGKQPDQV